jgi:hypothetical protein
MNMYVHVYVVYLKLEKIYKEKEKEEEKEGKTWVKGGNNAASACCWGLLKILAALPPTLWVRNDNGKHNIS